MWALARHTQRYAINCIAFDLIGRVLATYNDARSTDPSATRNVCGDSTDLTLVYS
jgi:hypothetical protein